MASLSKIFKKSKGKMDGKGGPGLPGLPPMGPPPGAGPAAGGPGEDALAKLQAAKPGDIDPALLDKLQAEIDRLKAPPAGAPPGGPMGLPMGGPPPGLPMM